MTQVTRAADARLAASIRSRSSMMFSAGGLVGWTIKTSAPRTFSSIRTKISPSANRVSVILHNSTPRCLAISSASPLLAFPESSLNPRSTPGKRSITVALKRRRDGKLGQLRPSCPRWIRTTILGSKDRCPAIGRGGIEMGAANLMGQDDRLNKRCRLAFENFDPGNGSEPEETGVGELPGHDRYGRTRPGHQRNGGGAKYLPQLVTSKSC